MGLLFAVVVACFTAWGIAADLTTPMVAGFKRIFQMSTFQASLVQLAYFGAYFLLALPAAFINERFGYKAGLLAGLGLAALGAFLFYPASRILTYEAFLVALFALAAGCSILETSANPYVISLGPEATATRRLNFAQAFNPLGTNIGVLVAATLILPKLDSPVDLASASPAQVQVIRAGQLGAVMGPYLGLGLLLLAIWIVIATQKAPKIVEEFPDSGDTSKGALVRQLWNNRRYRFGVVAQFFNVAAQVCTWTYLLQYVQQAINGSLQLGGYLLQVSLIIFLVSRFVMTWVIGKIRATKVLAALAALAVVLCLFATVSPNVAGVAALVAVSFCLSLMFPTIYGVALKGLGPATKFGAAGLVMAIVGGAIMPVIQGTLLDATSAATSYVVPAICFVVVASYAVFDLRQGRRSGLDRDGGAGVKRRTRLAVAAVALACTTSACGGGPAGSDEPTQDLEVVSWWTSGSEQQALDVLMNDYRAAHTGVTVTNAAVAGGGGGNAQVVLAQRLLAGKPPDTWQTFPGGALSRYVASGQLADLSTVYAQSGLGQNLPKVIADGLSVDGKPYGVPTSAHRGNMLFFNTALLAKAGVSPPTDGYTADVFAADLDKLDAAGVVPLCLGAKDAFTTPALFENTLLGVVGTDGWTRIAQDRFDWNGAQTRDALKRFGHELDRADPQAAAMSWDEATRKLASGGCAFETLNDSAFGELQKAGAVEGCGFGEVPYPGTGSSYVAVVDTFVTAEKAPNARNATDFLAQIATPETQLAFSRAKGSVPIRSDIDVSSLTPYQQSAAQALRTDTVLWSIVHGEATGPQLQQGFYDAVTTYVRTRDPDAFSKTLTDAVSQQVPAK